MRVYLPLSPADIRSDTFFPDVAWAVTDSLEASVGNEHWGTEDYEAAAMDSAARSCIGLYPDMSPTCRIVVAADVDDVKPAGTAPGQVALEGPVGLDDVCSIHIDEEETWPLVAQALADEDDEDELGQAALLWYDVTELAMVREILEDAE
ncbi:MAG: hypothetical protein E7A62_01690 [Actinomycetaceae bacterium]|nr:hypothetical protein [Actinomycetaceae bacterium]MDU0969690.1 hypothetical protein [Actinomycetaceae bacterium]